MNYLAHLLLSGNDEDVIFGNFIGDAIKGKQYQTIQAAFRKEFFSIGRLIHLQILIQFICKAREDFTKTTRKYQE